MRMRNQLKNSNTTIISFVLLSLILSGCQGAGLILPGDSTARRALASSNIVGDIDSDALPDDDSARLSGIEARVITQGSRANLREGPGLEFPIIGKGNPGASFTVIGRSEGGEWWQVCCTSEDNDSFEAGLTAWVANSVIELEGSADDLPTSDTIFAEDLIARWNVDWECGSTRCDISECTATVEATVGEEVGAQWLRMDHQVLWDETCFSTDEWAFEVNKFTGLERNGALEDNFLYRYWIGPLTGKANKIYELPNGRRVAAECTGPHEVEVEEGDGWTTEYAGYTCHDVRTGMLLSLTYEKRWLFTGEFEGQSYERQYFEDFELMEQNLIETNAELSYIDEE